MYSWTNKWTFSKTKVWNTTIKEMHIYSKFRHPNSLSSPFHHFIIMGKNNFESRGSENMRFMWWEVTMHNILVFTLSSQQTKIDTFANSVDPDKTARNKPSHQNLHYLPFLIDFWLKPLFATMDVSKFRQGSKLALNYQLIFSKRCL